MPLATQKPIPLKPIYVLRSTIRRMKITNKTIYTSKDGKEFDSEEECLKWESKKFKMRLNNLSDQQIINLILLVHPNLAIKGERTKIRLSINKGESSSPDGFGYNVIFNDGESRHNLEFSGIMSGCGDFQLRAVRENPMRFNPALSDGFSLLKVFEYLTSIGFFLELDDAPIQNPKTTVYAYNIIFDQFLRIDAQY